MENKNTNSTNSNRDENYIGRASSRKKENSSHGSEQSHGQNHSKSINRGHGQSEHRKSRPYSASSTGTYGANAHRRESKTSESGVRRSSGKGIERSGKVSQKSKKYTILISILAFVIVLGIVVAALWHIVDSYEPSVDIGPAGDTGAGTDNAALEPIIWEILRRPSAQV